MTKTLVSGYAAALSDTAEKYTYQLISHNGSFETTMLLLRRLRNRENRGLSKSSYPRNMEGGPGLQMSVMLNKLQCPIEEDAIFKTILFPHG